MNKTARFRALEPALMDRMDAIVQVSCEEEIELLEAFRNFHSKRDFFKARDEAFAENKEGFNVLCHGDLWFTNILFGYRNKRQPTTYRSTVESLL